ncbi:MAG: hypothetical protein J6T33_04160, partial [Bacteroidales bacterium]|nr:hypothetical protein [Bacteroidales bacterium]
FLHIDTKVEQKIKNSFCSPPFGLSKLPLELSSSPIHLAIPRFPGERSFHRATDFLQKSFGWGGSR